MASRGEDIASVLKRQIQEFSGEITMSEVGVVIEVGDGIARIHGLAGCRYNELLQFPNDIIGLALNLEEDSISAVLPCVLVKTLQSTFIIYCCKSPLLDESTFSD